jgi:NADPH:quinone reductase-like Zn-dependent oxidoreductase
VIDPLQEMVEDGTVEPVVGAIFGFEEASAAAEHHRGAGELGKVVLMS